MANITNVTNVRRESRRDCLLFEAFASHFADTLQLKQRGDGFRTTPIILLLQLVLDGADEVDDAQQMDGNIN